MAEPVAGKAGAIKGDGGSRVRRLRGATLPLI